MDSVQNNKVTSIPKGSVMFKERNRTYIIYPDNATHKEALEKLIQYNKGNIERRDLIEFFSENYLKFIERLKIIEDDQSIAKNISYYSKIYDNLEKLENNLIRGNIILRDKLINIVSDIHS